MYTNKMKGFYKLLSIVIVVACLITAFGCSSPSTTTGTAAKADNAPYKLGIVTSISGAGYGYGQRAIVGIRYKVEEEINKAGGINGRQIELITYDTGTRADQSAMLVERAATTDKVLAILGPNGSGDVSAAFPAANRLAVPDIAMGGTLRGICEKNSPWCFATMMSDDFSMEPLATLIDKYNAKTMVIMVDAKYSYAVSQGAWGYKIAERKGVKVLNEKGKLDIETNAPDLTPQVQQIKALNPDLICAILYSPDMGHLAKSFKGAGIDSTKTPCYASLMLQPESIAAGGDAVEGWYGSSDFDTEATDPVQAAWTTKMIEYGKGISTDKAIYTPSTNTACGYDAACFVTEAIKVGKITPDMALQTARQTLIDTLPKIKMKTYNSGEMYFGTGGTYEKNRLVKPIYLLQAKGGKIVNTGAIQVK